jgi:hypothetical protein
VNDLDVEHRLRRTYRAVAARTVVSLDREALRSHPGEQLSAGSLRRVTTLRIAATVLALVAAGAAVVVGVAGRDGEKSEVSTSPDVGRWERLPAAPVVAQAHGTVWTGTEMIEFGGFLDERLTAVAAYDPARRSWRRLADLPEEVKGASIGVWTGDEVVAFPLEVPGVGAVYDPATDEWHLISDSAIPSLNVESYAFWTGEKVLLVGYHPSAATADDNTLGAGASLYDPSTDRWQTLPEAPQPLSPNSDAVWTGQEMIFVGQAVGTEGMTALALDPVAGTWRVLPAPPLTTREIPLVVWTGSELVVVGGNDPPSDQDPDGRALRDGAAFDPTTARWVPYPAPPVAVYGNDIAANPLVTVVGGTVVAISTSNPDRRPLVLDTATRTWQLGPPAPDTLAEESNWISVSTGDEVLVWGVAGRPSGSLQAGFSFNPLGS